MPKGIRTASAKKAIAAVKEFHLSNGLRVLHKEVKAAPVVAVNIVYHVGSRNEAVGHTGSTHILEHLLFKDAEHHNEKSGNAIKDYLEWLGAQTNATTWDDRTHYYELVAKEDTDKALALEADRLRGSLFNEDDLRAEMTVVRNEFELIRNNPFELLDESIRATAFQAHPYHHPTIGWKEDIEFSTAKKLREFYDTFYWPNNATLTLIGDISLDEAKEKAAKYFGKIPRASHEIPEMRVKEPPQEGPRFVEIRKPGAVSAAMLAYKVPEGTHADTPALILLSAILGGGLSSRLVQKLVDTGLAADISVSVHPSRDPGLLMISVHAGDGVKPQKLLELIRKELDALKGPKPPSKGELVRAKEKFRAEAMFGRDGALRETRILTEAIAAGDWKLAYELEEKVADVTPKDVARVAKTYLRTEGETSGILIGTVPQGKKKK